MDCTVNLTNKMDQIFCSTLVRIINTSPVYRMNNNILTEIAQNGSEAISLSSSQANDKYTCFLLSRHLISVVMGFVTYEHVKRVFSTKSACIINRLINATILVGECTATYFLPFSTSA